MRAHCHAKAAEEDGGGTPEAAMQPIVKIFNKSGRGLEEAVNKFMDDWAEDNLGHLSIYGVTALDIQKIGGVDTEIWVTFRRHAASSFELDMIEAEATRRA
jgi:hypothetical protein